METLTSNTGSNEIKYKLENGSRCRIYEYDKATSFSSFLPGIGGLEGVPLWCMYVNRGQGVVSFGVGNKDNSIGEFLPANWAYQLVGTQGFRTFCKVDGTYYEPFQNDQASLSYNFSRSMTVDVDRLSVLEENRDIGLSFEAEYFSPVNQPLGSLIRVMKVANISGEPKKVNILDGLGLILPAGFTDFGIKAMRHITQAYASVNLVAGSVPFYSPKVMAHDEAEVVQVEKGNFYAGWLCRDSRLESIEPIVDPNIVFGRGNDLITPRLFIENDLLATEHQLWENRLPCALSPVNFTVVPGQSVKIIAVTGLGINASMTEKFLEQFESIKDIERLSDQSRNLIQSVTNPCMTVSSVKELDGYSRQNLLDNVLRGGVPVMLPSNQGNTPLAVYSRRHGDLERDYNFFELPPYPLSSGPGNYRDICQNRRSDILLYPELGDEEIRMFVSLLQADGYNPLGIEGYKWKLPEDVNASDICPGGDARARKEFAIILSDPFHPGQLLNWMNIHGIENNKRMLWLNDLLARCDRTLVASGHEGGYWVDHWIYITDMLESYASVYPDKVSKMLNAKADIGWFDEGAHVVARDEKYFLKSYGPVQLHAVVDNGVSDTPLPRVTVFAKLCALLAIKAVSFDHCCKGIEMEAGRPGWNDSLNGLPGLFGSSTCEAAAAANMAGWLLEHLPENADNIFPVEIADLIDEVISDLNADQYDWERTVCIREAFRERIRKNICGKKRVLKGEVLKELLQGVKDRCLSAVERSLDRKTGLIHTYFINEPVEYDPIANRRADDLESPAIKIKAFSQKPMPLFLEGQVHLLRLTKDNKTAAKIYDAVQKSSLMDTVLNMYKLNECLVECPAEIGRARTFTRGWFENESIWVHMLYKYLFELLRCGLYEEFFEDAKTMLVPFMDANVYGRSILENSSFIASSACPDPEAVGKGFIARLSGSTAEFIAIWLKLTVGDSPFFVSNGELEFSVSPVLPGQWFTKQSRTVRWQGRDVEIPSNCFGCALLGSILMVYHNEKRKDTFGSSPAKPVRYIIDGKEVYHGNSLNGNIAEKIRQRKVERIDVLLD